MTDYHTEIVPANKLNLGNTMILAGWEWEIQKVEIIDSRINVWANDRSIPFNFSHDDAVPIKMMDHEF